MAQGEDPLAAFVSAEAARIEQELDSYFARTETYLRFELALTAPAKTSADSRSFRWRYHYTWQEAERARRYVWRLPFERALASRQSVEAQLDTHLRAELDRLGTRYDLVTLPLALSAPQVTYRERLRAYEVSVSIQIGALSSR